MSKRETHTTYCTPTGCVHLHQHSVLFGRKGSAFGKEVLRNVPLDPLVFQWSGGALHNTFLPDALPFLLKSTETQKASLRHIPSAVLRQSCNAEPLLAFIILSILSTGAHI